MLINFVLFQLFLDFSYRENDSNDKRYSFNKDTLTKRISCLIYELSFLIKSFFIGSLIWLVLLLLRLLQEIINFSKCCCFCLLDIFMVIVDSFFISFDVLPAPAAPSAAGCAAAAVDDFSSISNFAYIALHY